LKNKEIKMDKTPEVVASAQKTSEEKISSAKLDTIS